MERKFDSSTIYLYCHRNEHGQLTSIYHASRVLTTQIEDIMMIQIRLRHVSKQFISRNDKTMDAEAALWNRTFQCEL